MKSRAGLAATVWLGRSLIRALGMTWRFTPVNDSPVRALLAGRKPFIFALWHGELLHPMFFHRNRNIAALISEHRDGEIIAKIIEGLGFDTVRGSTTRGAARALLAVIRKLESGSVVAITPDGPRGPRHELQPGVLAAAQRAGVPIVFIRTHITRYWEFKSWDRFRLAKPFSRITMVFSDPEFVDAGVRDVSTEIPRFMRLSDRLAAQARETAARG